MNQASGYRSTYQHYPFLNKEEFTEACHHLDNKYCHATLGPLRKKWRLNVCTALDTSFAADSDYTTFLQITRPLEDESGLGDLETILDDFSMDEVNDDTSGADLSMKDLENSDQVSCSTCCIRIGLELSSGLNCQEVLHRRPQPNFGHVKYEIHLHPTYRAPCLWFSLHDLPQHEAAFDIETVFRRLVPTQFKDALRGGGPIGGISADVSSPPFSCR